MTTSLSKISEEIPPASSIVTETGSGSATGTHAATTEGKSTAYRRGQEGPLMLVPAGFVADMLSSLSGTIGEVTGGLAGNAKLGRRIGEAASPLVELLPFQTIPPRVAPQSAGPEDRQRGADQTLIVVPTAFVGGVLGGIGGNLLGGAVGKWLGNEEVGSSVGSTVGSALGGLLPFQVVPPTMTPQSAQPGGGDQGEPMVVVPAGFFGNVLSGLAGTIGDHVAGDTGRQVGEAASPLLKLLPFQAVPSDLAPQSAGPEGTGQQELVVLPAGFFGNLLSGMAESVGGAVGGMFGDAQTGKTVGKSVAPVLNMLPFHVVPPGLMPQSAGPSNGSASQEQMLFVPAGLFGNLLNAWGGTLGSLAGEAVGEEEAGKAIGEVAASLGKYLPFSVVPSHV